MSLSTGSRIGPYEITGLLGAGGMGEVYRARDAKLQRDVAIKTLPPAFAADPDRLARFEREAQVLASLNHPNIAAIYGFEEGPAEAGLHMRGLVLELVEGATLADRIAQGPVPLDESLAIARQIADALEAAHEQGIIHRDLKPANIKLRPDGTVKVLDFGLAKLSEAGGVGGAGQAGGVGREQALSLSPTIMSPAVTQLGVILGTAAYMSPEQARGKAVDRRADVWAFGCVLYEMLTGVAPFAGEDVSLTLSKVLQRDVDWGRLSPSARSVEPLLRRCLEKDPRMRLRDIGEARIALDPAASRLADTAAPTPAGGRRSVPLGIGSALLVAAAAVAGIGAWIAKPGAADAPTMPVVRVAVSLPAGDRLAVRLQRIGSNSWLPIALSPDGAQLVYVSDGRLSLRAMNSLESRDTQGTDGAESPFFSPDGEWVGFFAQGQLRKVSVAGGVATPLTDAPVAAGGSWGEDDSIYFVPSNMSGVWKVAASGGAAEMVTTLDRSAGEVSHRWPHVLPGGGAILFTVWRGPGWDEMDVQLLDLATGQRSVVVRGATTGRYVPSGHVVYARAGELTAVPFDLIRKAVTGEPIALGITVLEGEGALYTVSDTGVLAYVPGKSQFERRLVSGGPDGAVENLNAPLRAYEDVVPAPDGRRLAMTVQGATWGIWVFDPSRRTETLLTRGAATSQWPVWTPDGTRLIYRGTRAGSRNLYWRRADGTGDEERLTTSETMQTPESVSPDGAWLVYLNVDPKTGSDIWLMALDGDRAARPLIQTAANETTPQLSPDGRWLAYSSNESGRSQIYVQPFPGPGERVPVSTDGGIQPRWAPDGRHLFFVNAETVLEAPIVTTPALRVGAPRALFTAKDRLVEYSISPAGRFLGVQVAKTVEAATPIHVVVNWFEELRRLVPAN